MKESKTIHISLDEYHQKKFEVARDLLASAVSAENFDMTDTETKQSESIIFNCSLLAEMLMKELGYVKATNSEASVHNLKDLLKK